MVYEGQSARGAILGDYAAVVGIMTILHLTGADGSKALEFLLQKK